MIKIIYLLAGGALGALARYAASGLTHRYFGATFPYGTMAVNLSGSLLIGLLWGYSESFNIPSNLRIFIFIGLLGSFTTFSTYSLETLNLFRDGETRLALINIFVSNILGLVLVFLGYLASKGVVNLIR